uniref:Uncharacterized protein n=1 Tax=Arundo donax TaxID=35708 RepID=A0A0A9TVQ6_ARUDO
MSDLAAVIEESDQFTWPLCFSMMYHQSDCNLSLLCSAE